VYNTLATLSTAYVCRREVRYLPKEVSSDLEYPKKRQLERRLVEEGEIGVEKLLQNDAGIIDSHLRQRLARMVLQVVQVLLDSSEAKRRAKGDISSEAGQNLGQ
jgi:hypothetical protein